MDGHLKWDWFGILFFCINNNANFSSCTDSNTDLPQIVSWDDGHGYLESGEMLLGMAGL